MSRKVVVVGGGIIGAMHALLAKQNGCAVTHLEREPAARGASVRNFGLVWMSGRAAGPELALAQRSRELLAEIGRAIPAIGFRDGGSLTVALDEREWSVVQSAGELPDAAERGFELLERHDVTSVNPAERFETFR